MKKMFNNLEYGNKILVIVGAFIIMLCFVLFGPNVKSEKPVYNKTNIYNMFKTIKDNYSIEVKINNDYSFKYYLDGTDIKIVTDKTYFKRYNKMFLLNEDNSLSETNDVINNYIKDTLYYDISFIKELLGFCEYEDKSETQTICKLKATDFFTQRNKRLGLKYGITDDRKVVITINHEDGAINSLKIDYTVINEILNESDAKLIYDITIININSNNFKEITEKNKELLNNVSTYVNIDELMKK